MQDHSPAERALIWHVSGRRSGPHQRALPMPRRRAWGAATDVYGEVAPRTRHELCTRLKSAHCGKSATKESNADPGWTAILVSIYWLTHLKCVFDSQATAAGDSSSLRVSRSCSPSRRSTRTRTRSARGLNVITRACWSVSCAASAVQTDANPRAEGIYAGGQNHRLQELRARVRDSGPSIGGLSD
jgi:hypothetical protein